MIIRLWRYILSFSLLLFAFKNIDSYSSTINNNMLEENKNTINQAKIFIPNEGLLYLYKNSEINTIQALTPKKNIIMKGFSNKEEDYESFYIKITDEFGKNLENAFDSKVISIEPDKRWSSLNYVSRLCDNIKFKTEDLNNITISGLPENINSLLTCQFVIKSLDTNKIILNKNLKNFQLKINYPFESWVQIAETYISEKEKAKDYGRYIPSSYNTAISIKNMLNKIEANNKLPDNIKDINLTKNIEIRVPPASVVKTVYLDFSSIYKINVFPDVENLKITGFRLESPQSIRLFPNNTNVKNLVFSGNVFPKIPEFAFNQFKKLEYIDLTGNHIREIDNKAFQGLSNLKEVITRHNLELTYTESSKVKKYQYFCGIESLTDYETKYKPFCQNDFIPSNKFIFNSNTKEMIIKNNDKYLNLDLSFLNNLEETKYIEKMTIIGFGVSLKDNVNYIKKAFNLKELNFENNNIYDIPKYSFKGMKKIEKLSFNNSNIQFIEKNAFSGLENLTELTIKNNAMRIGIPDRTFGGIYKLKKLTIINSKLENIGKYFLWDLLDLSELNLSNNNINNIHVELFYNVPFLEILNLSNNNIKYLPHAVFSYKRLLKLKKLFLSNNSLIEGSNLKDSFSNKCPSIDVYEKDNFICM
ncbi:MAG: leucine-rich repeat domain-containing protein [Silvanigrellaceae bacterium]|nr:leucine-rich repeat domain-containing protein [Silvanigrellaceae bacterium]